jgi:hypothetical protein
VNDSAACGHQLGIASLEHSFTTMIVAVAQLAFEYVRHGLEAPVRMRSERARRKPVLHQGEERIGLFPVARLDYDANPMARPLSGPYLRFRNARYRSSAWSHCAVVWFMNNIRCKNYGLALTR